MKDTYESLLLTAISALGCAGQERLAEDLQQKMEAVEEVEHTPDPWKIAELDQSLVVSQQAKICALKTKITKLENAR
jgi:hypothetical protein